MVGVISFVPIQAHAFFGAGETLALAKILAENIKSLVELKKVVEQGQDSFNLLNDINRRIHDALKLLETINKAAQPGTFYSIKDLTDLKNIISQLYGVVPDGEFSEIQKIHDMTVAESFEMHNDLYDYAKKLDETGETMKKEADEASPGRAQKLAAQNQGAILQALAQVQRNEAQMIKLLAENVAQKNQDEKKEARGHIYKYEGLKRGFEGLKTDYGLPTLK